MECHHTVPVSEMKPGDKTKLSDLALVCANCHRMIHAKRPWLSIQELVGLIKKQH
ncbi:HNH endonuclease [Shimia thalassica]|uniref:HNH endonuclease n=1 Tax=Shimia thalassica TaxID=1715693 RepID=UPI0026E34406|nr:HNH endonuclease [Shimia thalassica]MDO6522910.1 HNH endonuclease [Shimia thalassica]